MLTVYVNISVHSLIIFKHVYVNVMWYIFFFNSSTRVLASICKKILENSSISKSSNLESLVQTGKLAMPPCDLWIDSSPYTMAHKNCHMAISAREFEHSRDLNFFIYKKIVVITITTWLKMSRRTPITSKQPLFSWTRLFLK